MKEQAELPYLTSDLSGTGGRIRVSLEDFVVEEQLLYEPSGQGEHVYIRFEKRGITTFEAVRRIARSLCVSPRDVGYAGMKDSAAVARQTVSVSGVKEAQVRALGIDGVRVLDIKRHGNKLRIGHLKGNRFHVTIRDVEPGALEHASAVVAALEARGVPNFYGPQRVGVRGRSAAIGLAILRRRFRRAVAMLLAPVEDDGAAIAHARRHAFAGDYNDSLGLFPESFTPERSAVMALRQANLPVRGGNIPDLQFETILKRIPRRFLELYVSALQARLFNEVLKARFDTFDRLLSQDLAWLHSNGAVFLVDDPRTEAPRAARLEISPSGPLFGTKMAEPGATPLAVESRVLERWRLTRDSFHDVLDITVAGARRPLRVPLAQASVAALPEADAIVVAFFLPKGSFATTVLAEIMKAPRSRQAADHLDE